MTTNLRRTAKIADAIADGDLTVDAKRRSDQDMLGSALETLLILMANVYSDEVDQTGKVPTVRGKPKPLLDWQFVELLRVAKAAQWLPSALNLEDRWSNRKARIGDYASVCRRTLLAWGHFIG